MFNSYSITALLFAAAATAASSGKQPAPGAHHRTHAPAPSEYTCLSPVYSQGRIDLYGVLSDGSLWYKFANPKGEQWTPEGHFAIIPASAKDCPSVAASVKHSPELLYVNRTGSNVLYKSGSAYQELMKPELNLGGSMQSVTAILSGVNQVDIFALDQKTRTYMYKQRQGNWWLPSQEEWMDLGGDFISKPATTVSAPGHVELIGLNSLNATIQLKSFKFNEDTEWKELPSGELQFIGHPIITSSGTVGKFDVWAIDSDGALHHMYFNGRGQYKKWENLGGEFSDTPDVVYNVQEDIIYIVGKDYKGTYHTKKYDGKQRQWLPSHNQWDTLIGPYSSQPGLLTTEEKDTLFVFGVDEENMVKMQKGTPYGWWPNAHLTEHIGTLPDYIEQKLPAFFGSSEL